MKKRYVTAILLASALASQSIVPAFASGSADSDDNEPVYDVTVYDPDAPEATITVDENGVKTTEAGTSTSVTGSNIAVVVETTTSSGETINVNDEGNAVVGNTEISFADGSAATAGLPETVVEAIAEINAGADLDTTITSISMPGYNALTGTHALVTRDAETGVVDDTRTEVVLYVPNLVENLDNVSVLYYNNATGRWELIPATYVDPVSKLVYVTVPGSGTLSVVYKN